MIHLLRMLTTVLGSFFVFAGVILKPSDGAGDVVMIVCGILLILIATYAGQPKRGEPVVITQPPDKDDGGETPSDLEVETGLYAPVYDFATSERCKLSLALIRDKQKDMIREGLAVKRDTGWTVDGSAAKGERMSKDNAKQLLRTFNVECETVIDHVRYNNAVASRSRI